MRLIKRKAFTLVELLVVIAIIGLLSTVAAVATTSAQMNSRNAKRKADLLQISKALELYYHDNGGYPVTSTAPTPAEWGSCGGFGGYPNSGAGAWIPSLAPTYTATLPIDPRSGKANPTSSDTNCQTLANINCYTYRSNGADYKIAAICTPEGTLSSNDPYYNPTSGRQNNSWALYSPGGRLW